MNSPKPLLIVESALADSSFSKYKVPVEETRAKIEEYFQLGGNREIVHLDDLAAVEQEIASILAGKYAFVCIADRVKRENTEKLLRDLLDAGCQTPVISWSTVGILGKVFSLPSNLSKEDYLTFFASLLNSGAQLKHLFAMEASGELQKTWDDYMAKRQEQGNRTWINIKISLPASSAGEMGGGVSAGGSSEQGTKEGFLKKLLRYLVPQKKQSN